MSDILTLARAVAEELREYKAELLYFPEFELRDLDNLRIVVVPAGTQYKTLSRAAHEELPKVQIGILKRCTEDELDGMLRFAEKLGLGFLTRDPRMKERKKYGLKAARRAPQFSKR